MGLSLDDLRHLTMADFVALADIRAGAGEQAAEAETAPTQAAIDSFLM